MINSQKGITIVVLVITIVVLLILSGIGIAQLNGSRLLKTAKEAKEKSKESQELENIIIGDYGEKVDGYLEANIPAKTMNDAQSNKMFYKTVNSIIQDEYGNQIVVPAGFKITKDATTANNGIVVIDANQNEFVWIPVPVEGKVYTNKEKTQFKTVQLNNYPINGIATMSMQSTERENPYYEDLSANNNTMPQSTNEFKASVAENKGYYIGRYNARTELERSSIDNGLTKLTLKEEDHVYNYVTQNQAIEACKNMYDETKPFTSDLMNKYALNTATLFLEECGTNKIEEVAECNVYDMESDMKEWTTEGSNINEASNAYRGGYACYSSRYNALRNNGSSTYNRYGNYAFRPILYIDIL